MFTGKKIGIWMPYGPGATVRGEGLMRLLILVARGLDPARNQFVFYCPAWLRREMHEEIQDYPEDIRHLFSVQSCWLPFSLLTLFMALKGKDEDNSDLPRQRPYQPSLVNRLTTWRRRLALKVRRLTLVLMSARTLLVMALVAAAAVVVAVSGGWPALEPLRQTASGLMPPAAIAALELVGTAGRAGLSWLGGGLLKIAVWTGMLAAVLAVGGAALWGVNLIAQRFNWSLRSSIQKVLDWLRSRQMSLYLMLQRLEFRRMAKYANRHADVDIWFTLHAAQDSAQYLKKPLVGLFADFVFFECPSEADERWLRQLRVKVHRMVVRADAIVVLSQHVRDTQLLPHFAAAATKPVYVIPHAMIDYRRDCKEIDAWPEGDSQRMIAANVVRTFASYQLARLQRTKLGRGALTTPRGVTLRYLSGFPFEHTTYVFSSTQNRAYKNIEVLVEAIKILIRDRRRNIKLIMTGHLEFGSAHDRVASLIRREQLHLDVLSLPRAPRMVHASLFKCAALTVHPSFFEAAFPWSFSESVSLGTPALMSRTPPTLEGFDPEEIGPYLFDPYSAHELADRIEWALANRETLLAQQTALLRRALASRDWPQVGQEYAQVFNAAANRTLGTLHPAVLNPSALAPFAGAPKAQASALQLQAQVVPAG